MPYIPTTSDDQREMLDVIGAKDIDELFAMIPPELRLDGELQLPTAMGEMELSSRMAALAGKNAPASSGSCFLGGGCYDHFVPAVVDFVAARSEFYTAYTPYQAEASQGSLQAFFEYQTLVTQLTGMDVSNASLYDGAGAAVEAVIMAMNATRRDKVVVLDSVHPEYRQTLATYLADVEASVETVATIDKDAKECTVSAQQLAAALDKKTACVLVQHPNFFGCLEDVEALAETAHAAGALLILAVNPVSLGLLKRPGQCGVDIVAAEGQPLGIPMSYGGPGLGIIACSEKFVRRMPGRLVGQTVDRRGRRCWVLTLQTREQHIRREKATSNICTNQGLMALRASVFLAAMGPQGMRQMAELCLQKAHYAMHALVDTGAASGVFQRPFFNEFVVRVKSGDPQKLIDAAAAENIFAGVPLGRWYPQLADCMLVAVTEKRTKGQIDRLAELVGKT
ncbi:MAG: aminomethyl-transferring glycine dehydrogenase subunit GcvPA [Planctomycetota bacterium]|nr:aminomethyl-transferring glycine dehydrogenase subunit GcvPA [Planctomycetota bacterium]